MLEIIMYTILFYFELIGLKRRVTTKIDKIELYVCLLYIHTPSPGEPRSGGFYLAPGDFHCSSYCCVVSLFSERASSN